MQVGLADLSQRLSFLRLMASSSPPAHDVSANARKCETVLRTTSAMMKNLWYHLRSESYRMSYIAWLCAHGSQASLVLCTGHSRGLLTALS